MVLSPLGVDARPHWPAVAPPLEERLASYPGGTVLRPPALRRPTLRAALPAWLSAIRTVRGADAVFWLQLSARPSAPLWALAYARPRARRSAWVIDAWAPQARKIGRLAAIQRLSPLFVGSSEAEADLCRTFPGLDVRWLPFAANTATFRDRGLERDVFAYWMGRRSKPLHEALERYCRERSLVYRVDRLGGEELGRMVSRSRYFVVTPRDLDDPGLTGGYSPLAFRYFEGLAAGARLLGVAPRSGELERLLPADALLRVPADGVGLAEALDRDVAGEAAARAATERAQRHVIAHHAWQDRADVIHAALQEPPAGSRHPG